MGQNSRNRSRPKYPDLDPQPCVAGDEPERDADVSAGEYPGHRRRLQQRAVGRGEEKSGIKQLWNYRGKNVNQELFADGYVAGW